jgi:putative urate catabolism protein
MAEVYNSVDAYPRDLIGYGANPPDPAWPGGARVAVQFVLNYEEGAERSLLHGDPSAEQALSEAFNPPSYAARYMGIESMYEFGARVGVWRILREFEKRGLPLTVFAVGMALERNAEVAKRLVASGHEIACHGWRWISYQEVEEVTEREHMDLAVRSIERLIGTRPVGWFVGRDSPNTRRLVADHGGFEYSSDYVGDELPFWMKVKKSDGSVASQLIVPYTFDCNDMRFSMAHGFSHAEPFFSYLRDTFDALYAEGARSPKMMSIGMHCRLLGRPGRIVALKKFLDHIAKYDRVWVCRRVDIARHWREVAPEV